MGTKQKTLAFEIISYYFLLILSRYMFAAKLFLNRNSKNLKGFSRKHLNICQYGKKMNYEGLVSDYLILEKVQQ